MIVPTFILWISVVLKTPVWPAELSLTLSNAGPELFQHVAEVRLPNAQTGGVPVVTDEDGRPVIVQRLEQGAWLLLVEGVWPTGETRRFRVTWSGQESRSATDLTLNQGESHLLIDNSYLGFTFPTRGNGGFPAEIRFPVSGTVEKGFRFHDRLYDRGRGWFSPDNDPEAAARVIEAGPLRVVVEQQFRYVKGNENPGGARATYRWTFTAYSPVVRVDAVVTRSGDLDFTWPEIHFLQISRDDDRFPLWAGGDPLIQDTLGPESHGQPLSRWGVLYNALDALGMGMEGGLTFWDGTTEYVTYLQRAETWEGSRKEYHADLYVGPARNPTDIRETLLASPLVVADARPVQAPEKAPIRVAGRLTNEQMELTFARNSNGSVGLAQIAVAGAQKGFIQAQAPDGSRLWRIVLRGRGLQDLTLASEQLGDCELDVRSDNASLAWKNVDLPDEPDALDVTVAVRLPAGSKLSSWRLSVNNRSKRYGMWEAHFPVIAGLGEPGELDVAVPRSNWGLLYRKLRGLQSGTYPSANWPMQMLTVNQGNEGLYLACHDPQAYPKTFHLEPGQEFRFSVWAADAGLPSSGFETPGEAVVGAYQGSWWQGCKLYREWALAAAPWTQKGRLSKRTDVPESIKNLALWFIGGGSRDEIVPAMLKVHEFFGLPVGLHWYNWHQIPFDTHYPEYFPAKPGFAEGVKELTSRGMLAMPYINARLHDMDIPSFQKAQPWCTKKENGENYLEIYPSQARQAVMCPYTEYWQKRINAVVERLVSECSVNAVYLDQIAAAGPALCFDATHGHPLGGGSHWVDGYRRLLSLTKEIGHRNGRDVAFTTENNAEPYMDGVDAFLIWNPRHPDEVPMMTAVYSGYTLYFSSPRMQNTPESFWMGQARDAIWGCQLGWMDPSFFISAAHAREAADLKRLGQYRIACLKFLTYGELVGELQPLEPLPKVQGIWDNWSGPPQNITLPAVSAAVWRAEDDALGLFIANLSEDCQRFGYRLEPEVFGGFKSRGKWLELRRIAPEGTVPGGYCPREGGERTEFLEPGELLVYEVGPTAKLPEAGRSQSRYEQRAALDAWCLARQVAWDALVPSGVASGEAVRAELRVTNGGLQPVTVEAALGLPSNEPMCAETLQIRARSTQSLRLLAPPLANTAAAFTLTLKFTDGKSAASVSIPALVRRTEPLTLVIEAPESVRAGESSTLVLNVTNNRSSMSDIRVGLRLPEGWQADPGTAIRIPRVEPHETRRAYVRIIVPEGQEGGRTGIEAFVIDARASSALQVLPARPRAQAYRVEMAPTIDGDLADWGNASGLRIGPESSANLKQYAGEEDLSGVVHFAWDDTFLYFGAEVTDQTHSQPHKHKDLWQSDCIQLALRPSGPARHPSYDGVHEFGLALTPVGPELWQWVPQERVVPDGRLAVFRHNARSTYEAAIPWHLLGFTPLVGVSLGLSLTLNDDDGSGFRGWLEWSSGVCGTKDASRFGVLDLIDPHGAGF